MAEKRILVVDDETVVRDLLLNVLSKEGYLVDTAANGRAAQQHLTQKGYALCLIDLRMPVMGGKELYTFIRDKYPALAERVIFLTGDTLGADTREFLNLSGRASLVKPFTLGELRRVVQKVRRHQ